MTRFTKVARVEDIPPGERLWFDFEDESVVVFNIAGKLYCIADICTHDGGPLEDGELDGYAVECPRHGARFDVRSGAALCLPATVAVPTYEVKVEGEDVLVAGPEPY